MEAIENLGAVVGAFLPNPLKPVESLGAIFNSADGNNVNKSFASERQLAELKSTGGTPIAGSGADVPLRDTRRLVAEYGGNASDWSKVTSESYTAAGHEKFG